MSPQRLQVKLFVKTGSIDKDRLINQFHAWIQSDRVDEVAIDVADYSHVPDGPGILLITHEADYAFDWYGGAGVRYVRKKDMPETLTHSVLLCYKQALQAAARLEQDHGQALEFDPSLVEVTLLDRRLYPNTADSDPVPLALTEIFTSLFDESDAITKRAPQDPRYPFSVRITVPHTLSIEAILEKIDHTHFLVPLADTVLVSEAALGATVVPDSDPGSIHNASEGRPSMDSRSSRERHGKEAQSSIQPLNKN